MYLVEQSFASTFKSGVDMWRNAISASETSSVKNAHLTIRLDNIVDTDETPAYASPWGSQTHFRTGLNTTDATIVYRRPAFLIQLRIKRKLQGMKIGHLWGIDDLYSKRGDLQSIYSQCYAFDYATRHDQNAMSIGKNNMWYITSTDTLKHFKALGQFYANEWMQVEGGAWYYFKSNGEIATGWQTIGGKHYRWCKIILKYFTHGFKQLAQISKRWFFCRYNRWVEILFRR